MPDYHSIHHKSSPQTKPPTRCSHLPNSRSGNSSPPGSDSALILIHGPRHWRTVLRNGLYLCRHHAADEEVVRFFALFHDSCREDEYADPLHGPRGAQLALAFREAGHFHLDDIRMDLLVTACEIHNGAPPQTDPTLAVCLDADRLDLGRVGITPNPTRLSTSTARDIATRFAWHELESIVL